MLGDAEVGEVDVFGHVAREKHVRRLDVAMHQSVGVGGVEGGCELARHTARPHRVERPVARERASEVSAVDETTSR